MWRVRLEITGMRVSQHNFFKSIKIGSVICRENLVGMLYAKQVPWFICIFFEVKCAWCG